jgi:transposase
MRPKGSSRIILDRRLRALEMLKSGLSLNEVARKIGCAPSSVMRWRDRKREGGKKGLAVGKSPGRPRRLDDEQRRELVQILLAGPAFLDYPTDLWTTTRIAEVIRGTFGVDYHPAHVGRLMHQLGWTPQKPERRARERDEGKIRKWIKSEWPRVKKTPRGWVPISSSSTSRGSS